MRRLILVLFLASTALAACTSTGDPNHPIKFYGPRFYLYGHEKYTPLEKAYARCVYRNRLPDGSRSGFSRECRLKATQFPMGINAAMYASACKMEKCYGAAAAFYPQEAQEPQ